MRRLMQLSGSLAALAVAITAAPALAHHGWTWAVEEQSTLHAIVTEVSMAPPHPSLKVRDAQGTIWQIDLGNPNQTERSGFTGTSAKAGDAITVLGNKHKDAGNRLMKAVRITVGTNIYDMYPERIRAK